MKRLLVFVGCMLLVAAPLGAQASSAEITGVHVVRRGDTLWDLSAHYLKNPFLWPEIFRANRDVVADPHWIYPLERLRIPGLTNPGLVVQPLVSFTDPEGERTVFFRVAERAEWLRVQTLQAVQIPIVRPGDFYRAGFLVQDAEVVPVGALAEVVSPTVVPLETQRAIQLYDRVFMTIASPNAVTVGDRIQLLRRGRAVAGFGRVFASTGVARVEAVQGGVATVVIEVMYSAVLPGDWAVPIATFPVEPGVVPQPGTALQGRVVAFQTPHALQSVEDLAFLDLGSLSGVREGDEFVVVLPPTRASWGVRPEIEVARLQVVRTTDRTAAVRVIQMQHPALEPGLPVRRVLAMP